MMVQTKSDVLETLLQTTPSNDQYMQKTEHQNNRKKKLIEKMKDKN
jgi:hypothetical protein